MRVAVVGGGIAGITASWLLQRDHDVTLLEAAPRLGGHANTVTLDDGTSVDTAFLIFNTHTYPLFRRLLAEWDVERHVVPCPMTFGLFDRARNRYFTNGGLRGLFAQKRNLGSRAFLRFLWHARRFTREAWADLQAGRVGDRSLAAYLSDRGYPEDVAEQFVYPLGAAVWSLPGGELRDFPASAYIRFFGHHAQLKREQGARWLAFDQGSQVYVDAFRARFRGDIRVGTPVRTIRRGEGGCSVVTDEGAAPYDRVVVATHADVALRLLERPTADEVRVLGAWRYRDNEVVLHTDASLLPPWRAGWATWNVVGSSATGFGITYWLNSVHGIGGRPLLLTLGDAAIEDRHVRRTFSYRHPVLDAKALASQDEIGALGSGGVRFCGSYAGEGFHEDAVRSAARVARSLGVAWD